MNAKTLTKINLFLFMLWLEILIFSFSLIITTYLLLPFSSFIVDRYGYLRYDAFRIAVMFSLIVMGQYFYKGIISRAIKLNIKNLLFIINSCGISVLVISFLLKKTMLSKYFLIYPGIFIVYLIPFSGEIINKSKKLFIK